MSSSVDWCEENYAVCPYIAEYWNTLSGFGIIVASLLSNVCRRNTRMEHAMTFSMLAFYGYVIGTGTVLFHATLSYPFQLLDEIPLILLFVHYSYFLFSLDLSRACFIEYAFHNDSAKIILKTCSFLDPFHPSFRRLLLQFAYAFVLFIFPFSMLVSASVQFYTFHVCLKVFEILTCVLALLVVSQQQRVMFFVTSNYDSSRYAERYIRTKKELSIYLNVAGFAYAIGITCWLLDFGLCSVVPFHAVWHVCSSVSLFCINQTMSLFSEIDLMLVDFHKTK